MMVTVMSMMAATKGAAVLWSFNNTWNEFDPIGHKGHKGCLGSLRTPRSTIMVALAERG